MAGPVYSTRFFDLQGHTGDASYTVPAGFRAVLRDWDCYAAADLTGSIDARILGSAGQSIDWFTVDVDTTVMHQWRGRQVLEEGETFRVTSTGAVDHTLSGYLLSLP